MHHVFLNSFENVVKIEKKGKNSNVLFVIINYIQEDPLWSNGQDARLPKGKVGGSKLVLGGCF